MYLFLSSFSTYYLYMIHPAKNWISNSTSLPNIAIPGEVPSVVLIEYKLTSPFNIYYEIADVFDIKVSPI